MVDSKMKVTRDCLWTTGYQLWTNMNKRYNKSESRKNRPYNKSKRRRPHPPYDQSRPQERSYAPKVLEMERDDALDFEIPKVDWELPTIGEIDPGALADVPNTDTDITVPEPPKVETSKPKPKIDDLLELPEFEVKPKQAQPQVKVAPKSKAPQSLGQKPKPLTKEQQIQREIQRRQAAQQQQRQQRPQTQRNTQVHPAAIVGPLIIMFIVIAFLSTAGVPPIIYLIVLFFFGRQIWNVIQGGGQGK